MPSVGRKSAKGASSVVTSSAEIRGDVDSFTHDELACMNQVLVAILNAHTLKELLEDVCSGLQPLASVKGCAAYRTVQENGDLARYLHVGEAAEALPDLIPTGSDLYNLIKSRSVANVQSEDTSQLCLFADQPWSHYSPIIMNGALKGALACVYGGAKAQFVSTVLYQATTALELLCKADALGGCDFTEDKDSEGIRHQESAEGDLSERERLSTLTAREVEVLDLLSKGLSNKEIASQLFISTATSKHHVQNILNKLQVKSRSAAVAVCLSCMEKSTPRHSRPFYL